MANTFLYTVTVSKIKETHVETSDGEGELH